MITICKMKEHQMNPSQINIIASLVVKGHDDTKIADVTGFTLEQITEARDTEIFVEKVADLLDAVVDRDTDDITKLQDQIYEDALSAYSVLTEIMLDVNASAQTRARIAEWKLDKIKAISAMGSSTNTGLVQHIHLDGKASAGLNRIVNEFTGSDNSNKNGAGVGNLDWLDLVRQSTNDMPKSKKSDSS